MGALEVFRSSTIGRLREGDNFTARLYATDSLLQFYTKGTDKYVPNWAELSDAERPVIYPRVYSANKRGEVTISDIGWKYNNQQIIFNVNGVSTAPDICAGKLRKTTYEGVEALRLIGNVASETNNTPDIIAFHGTVMSNGKEVDVSAQEQIEIQEAVANLYQMRIAMQDHIINGDETSLNILANLYNSGNLVNSGAQYEFINAMTDEILRAKGTSSSFNIHKNQVHGSILVNVKAYVADKVVAEAQTTVIDKTDPYEIHSSVPDSALIEQGKGAEIIFSLVNQRTGAVVPSQSIAIRVFKYNPREDISNEFVRTSHKLTITENQLDVYNSLNWIAGPVTIN